MDQTERIEAKECINCKSVYPLQQFHSNKANKDGYSNRCKACVRVMTRNYINRMRSTEQKPSITERKCCDCDIIKPIKEFFKNRCDKFGYQRRCKICNRLKTLIFKQRHPAYWHDRGKRVYAAIQDKKTFNKGRYALHRDSYLKRREKERGSVRGRLSDVLHSARYRAKEKELPADIDLEWLLEKYRNQSGCCGITRLPLLFGKNPIGKKGYTPYAPSLHRVNHEKGYTKDNVMLVSVIANLGMNRFGEDAFRIMCEAFYENTHQVVVLSSARFGNRIVFRNNRLEEHQ